MTGKKPGQAASDYAARSAPIHVFGGCIGGLLLGVIFGSIPYGLCAGVFIAIATWFISTRARASKGQGGEDPRADAQ